MAEVGGVHADGVTQGVATAVAVDGEAYEGTVDGGEGGECHVVAVYRGYVAEGAAQPAVRGGVEHPQGVGPVVAAAVVAAADDCRRIGPHDVEGAPQGVDALVVGYACHQSYGDVAGVGEVQQGCRREALGAVGQQPAEGFHGLAGADGCDAVAADGAAVGELQVELAVGHRQRGVEERQREAGAGEGAHGEVALRVVDERQAAVVGDAVVAWHPDACRVRDGRRGVEG